MTTLEDQRDYYDARWAGFETADSLDLARCAAILSRMAKYGLHSPRICDLGCGAGWLSGILGCFGPTVAVDISQTAIERARQRFPYVDFVCADALKWECPCERFDIVVSQEVLEHIEDQAGYIESAARLLTGGGRLILTTPNRPTVLAMKPEKRSTQPIETWLTAAQLRTLLRRHFDDIDVASIVLGGATDGVYKLINSFKVRSALGRLGLIDAYERLMTKHCFGLHLIATAVRR